MMNSEDGSKSGDAESIVDDEESVETVVLSEPQITDNVGDVSVEINVEELIADIESENDEDAARKKEVRRRLEDMAEEKSFEDTYAIDLKDAD
jgi:hypothetical protein